MNSIDEPKETRKIITLKQAKELSVNLFNEGKNKTKYPTSGNMRMLIFNNDKYHISLCNDWNRLYVYIYIPVSFHGSIEEIAQEVKEYINSKG
jgi:hypothetical protein